jgi:long-chain fatty acid transport protein
MRTCISIVLAMGFIANSVSVLAQSNAEVNAGIQFDFSLPGARSTGMGGAFVALADDATSVWANPAGLTNLSRAEVSGEGRFWDFNNLVANHGHQGQPTNIGVDTVAGLVDTDSNSYSGALSFFSYALPRNRWALGFYGHQVARYRADITSNGVFLDRTATPAGLVRAAYTDRVEAFTGTMNLDVADYGASIGTRISDKLAIGGTLAVYRLKMDATTARFYYAPFTGGNPFPYPDSRRPEFVDSGEYFGPANFTGPNEFFHVTEAGTDWNVGFNVGTLYRANKWSAGGAYRFGPKFHYKAQTIVPTTFVPAAFDPTDTGAPFYSQFKGQLFDEENETFDLPDTLALGFAVRPRENFVVSFEYDRVWYSQISDNNAEVFGLEERAGAAGIVVANQIRNSLFFPDVNQIRGGGEYIMVRQGPDIALRLGGWYDPDHRMRFEGDADPRISVLFRPGSDEFHIAPGFGLTFDRFQVDAALDISQRINTFSVSSVYRF